MRRSGLVGGVTGFMGVEAHPTDGADSGNSMTERSWRSLEPRGPTFRSPQVTCIDASTTDANSDLTMRLWRIRPSRRR